jgi:hypothetical protein
MSIYLNKSNSLKTIFLKDGSGVFLKRKEKTEVDDGTILRIQDGVIQEHAPKNKRVTPKSRQKIEEPVQDPETPEEFLTEKSK